MPRHAAILTTLLATTASAQITVPASGPLVSPSLSFQPNANAAYSNITNSPDLNSGVVTFGLLPTSFDDLTAAPSMQGRVVQQLRVPVFNGSFNPEVLFNSMRILVGFWNADGPSGLAGTPLLNVSGTAAHYRSAIINAPRGESALWTLDLGNEGFVVPSGRFFIGISLDTTSNNPANILRFSLMNYSPPTVGTTQDGYHLGQTPGVGTVAGIPWGQTLGLPGGPLVVLPAVGFGGPGIELIVPAPSSIGALTLCGLLACRRRRVR
jgi:hypothetical protein